MTGIDELEVKPPADGLSFARINERGWMAFQRVFGTFAGYRESFGLNVFRLRQNTFIRGGALNVSTKRLPLLARALGLAPLVDSHANRREGFVFR